MNHENHPQFSQLSIILIFICSLMLTACEIDNTDKTDEHRVIIKDSSWQLTHIYINNEWVTPAVYSDFNIQDLRFIGSDKYQITIYNHDGNKSTHTFYGNYQYSDNSIIFSDNNDDEDYHPMLFSLNYTNIDNTNIEGGFTIYEDKTVIHNNDGSTSFIPNTHSYHIRLKRK